MRILNFETTTFFLPFIKELICGWKPLFDNLLFEPLDESARELSMDDDEIDEARRLYKS